MAVRCIAGLRRAVLVIGAAACVAGCGQKDVRTIGKGSAPTNGQISKEDLGEQLDKFAEFYKALLRATANELNEKLKSQRVEKTTLQMRARMLQGLNTMLDQEDPVTAFVEIWGLCARFRVYLEEGEGVALFGDSQSVAVEAGRRLEGEIERIGRIFLKDDVFEATRKSIMEFANANPIKGTFFNVTVFATEVRKGQPNPFLGVLKIPMTPFRAIEGVDRTATEIRRFTDMSERFSDIVREMPESTRWQMQLLLYDLEETEMTKTFLAALTQFSQSSERLSKSIEALPGHLGEQFEKSVEQIDSGQTNIQKTLEQAEKTTLAINEATKEINKAAESMNTLAGNVGETAAAWETAAKASGEVIREFAKISPEPKGESSFDLKDYRAAAEQTSQAANDIKSLLAALDEFSKSRDYGSLLTRITIHLAGLLVLIFVLAVLYRVLSVKLRKSKAA
ncbi:MAG: hypothetical protein JW720_11520 [Sedimentisphaerales bacterium]|nr:hypothetical protein [Sedimentisphaerales bacterium]